MTIEADIRILLRNPTLAVLEGEALRQLATGAERLTLRQGDTLFRRDEVSDAAYLLVSGSIGLDASDKDSTRQHIVEPPTLIGDMALIAKTRRPATATAREQSVLLKIPRQLFLRVLSDSPRSAEKLKRLLSDRLTQFMKDLDGVAKLLGDKG